MQSFAALDTFPCFTSPDLKVPLTREEKPSWSLSVIQLHNDKDTTISDVPAWTNTAPSESQKAACFPQTKPSPESTSFYCLQCGLWSFQKK